MSQYHILVVDDDQFGREMTAKLLKSDGFRVTQAFNGEEALEKITRDVPDVILMDLSLPVLDGWETTRRIRALSSGKAVPVIALTAHAMTGDRERAFEVGCDDYVSKPLDYAKLKSTIEAVLDKG